MWKLKTIAFMNKSNPILLNAFQLKESYKSYITY